MRAINLGLSVLKRYLNYQEYLKKLLSFVVNDQFITDRIAGSVNGTQAEPGGSGTSDQLTRHVTDSLNTKVSISDGKLKSGSKTGTADPRIYYGPFARTPGLTAKFTFNFHKKVTFGWSSGNGSPVITDGVVSAGSPSMFCPSGVPSDTYLPTFIDVNREYTVWITLFNTGGAIWIQGGIGSSVAEYVNPTLLWVFFFSSAQTEYLYLFSLVESGAISSALEIDNLEVSINSLFSSIQSISNIYESNPVSGNIFSSFSKAIHVLDIAEISNPNEGDFQELRFRIQDSSNYWALTIILNGVIWDANVNLVESGVPTLITSYPGLSEFPKSLLVVTDGNKIHPYICLSNNTWLIIEQVLNATFNSSVDIAYVSNAGTASLLKSFKREWEL